MQSRAVGRLPGGYGYRHNIRNTNFFEVVERGEPYPTHEPDPADSALARDIAGDRQIRPGDDPLPEVMKPGRPLPVMSCAAAPGWAIRSSARTSR